MALLNEQQTWNSEEELEHSLARAAKVLPELSQPQACLLNSYL